MITEGTRICGTFSSSQRDMSSNSSSSEAESVEITWRHVDRQQPLLIMGSTGSGANAFVAAAVAETRLMTSPTVTSMTVRTTGQ